MLLQVNTEYWLCCKSFFQSINQSESKVSLWLQYGLAQVSIIFSHLFMNHDFQKKILKIKNLHLLWNTVSSEYASGVWLNFCYLYLALTCLRAKEFFGKIMSYSDIPIEFLLRALRKPFVYWVFLLFS